MNLKTKDDEEDYYDPGDADGYDVDHPSADLSTQGHSTTGVCPAVESTHRPSLQRGRNTSRQTTCHSDYRRNLASADGSRTELEAIYCIRTDDGVNIHVRNRGIIYNGKDANGQPSFYFKAAPQFEAPADSRYAWLNNALFVCQPEWTQEFKGIVLNVWKVK